MYCLREQTKIAQQRQQLLLYFFVSISGLVPTSSPFLRDELPGFAERLPSKLDSSWLMHGLYPILPTGCNRRYCSGRAVESVQEVVDFAPGSSLRVPPRPFQPS